MEVGDRVIDIPTGQYATVTRILRNWVTVKFDGREKYVTRDVSQFRLIEPKPECKDGDKKAGHVCVGGKWQEVTVAEPVVPPEPAAGEKRSPVTCWDKSVIHAEKYDATLHRWVPSGETCPVKVCTEGSKRLATICPDGSVIHRDVCRNNAWVPTGETCPPKPECKEGDKKPGHICVDGKWKEVTVPEPVVEPTVPEPEVEEPCYIKFDVPWLDLLPGIPCPWWVLPIVPGFKKTKKP